MPPSSLTVDLENIFWTSGDDLMTVNKLRGELSVRRNVFPDSRLVLAFGKHLQQIPSEINERFTQAALACSNIDL